VHNLPSYIYVPHNLFSRGQTPAACRPTKWQTLQITNSPCWIWCIVHNLPSYIYVPHNLFSRGQTPAACRPTKWQTLQITNSPCWIWCIVHNVPSYIYVPHNLFSRGQTPAACSQMSCIIHHMYSHFLFANHNVTMLDFVHCFYNYTMCLPTIIPHN